MDREKVIRRLRYLRNWEFANIFLTQSRKER